MLIYVCLYVTYLLVYSLYLPMYVDICVFVCNLSACLFSLSTRPCLFLCNTCYVIETLKELETLPAESVYRHSVQQLTQHRLSMVQKYQPSSSSLLQLEQSIQCGQVEELIQQAEQELSLLGKVHS
jgi:hypothetical protein